MTKAKLLRRILVELQCYEPDEPVTVARLIDILSPLQDEAESEEAPECRGLQGRIRCGSRMHLVEHPRFGDEWECPTCHRTRDDSEA